MDWMIALGALNMFGAGLCAAMFFHKLADERKFSAWDLFLIAANLTGAFMMFSQ